MTRRVLLQTSLPVASMVKTFAGRVQAGGSVEPATLGQKPSPLERIRAESGAEKVTFSNGIVTVACDKRSGLASYLWAGTQKVEDAYSSVRLGQALIKSTDYARHEYDGKPLSLDDRIGKGLRFTIVHSGDNRPRLLQHFTLYEGKPFFLVRVEIQSSQTISTNYIGAVVVATRSGVRIGTGSLNRVLRVPFDNDMWVRYNAVDINSSGLSSEVTAAYDNGSRNGLVFGSVNHDAWKTGVRFSGSNGFLDELEVFSGMATRGVTSLTHDTLPHGKLTGRSIASPAVFVGYYDDWRAGLEEYARVNAAFEPPLAWEQGIPFGWISWAAYRENINDSSYLGVVDFISKKLAPDGFKKDGVLYLNLDAFWSRLDAAQLRDAVDCFRNLGRKNGIEYRPGIYLAPFGQWTNKSDDFVEGTNLKYRYQDILLKQPDGTPLPKLAGGVPLDPTHPGTKARIHAYVGTFKELGFKYLKLDFLSHAALEGAHWDKSVGTGIQAYNHGMRFLLDEIGGDMFISLSIAPLFPGGYGHARRISCDTFGHISGRNESTEYMLNSLTYGWWTSPSIYIADPDEIPLGPVANQGARSLDEARSRFLSAVISGGMILDSSAFPDDPVARQLAGAVYTNRNINALAGGKAFRPVEGNTGDQAADVFVREENGVYYLAVFNCDFEAGSSKLISLERIAKPLAAGRSVAITDVWTGASLQHIKETLNISLGPAESKLLKLVPSAGS